MRQAGVRERRDITRPAAGTALHVIFNALLLSCIVEEDRTEAFYHPKGEEEGYAPFFPLLVPFTGLPPLPRDLGVFQTLGV